MNPLKTIFLSCDKFDSVDYGQTLRHPEEGRGSYCVTSTPYFVWADRLMLVNQPTMPYVLRIELSAERLWPRRDERA